MEETLTECVHSIFLSYVFDLGTHHLSNSASWRIPVGLQLVWGIALLSGIFFLPESPYVPFTSEVKILSDLHLSPPVRRHLLGTGQREEAERVVALLNGVPTDHVLVSEIIEELDYGIRAENEGGKATWMECFSSRSDMWKRTGNGMMLQFIQQLNGQNFYCEYTDKMFKFSET